MIVPVPRRDMQWPEYCFTKGLSIFKLSLNRLVTDEMAKIYFSKRFAI